MLSHLKSNNGHIIGLLVAGAGGGGHDLSPGWRLRGQEEGGHQAPEGGDGHGQGLLEIKTGVILDRVSVVI